MTKYLLVLLLCFSAQFVLAQTQTIEPEEKEEQPEDFKNKKWKERIVVGGSLGATFGNTTYVEVSPLVGYRITDRLTSGVGFTYQYLRENYNAINFDDYKATIIGGRIFSQYDLIYGLFAHAEYEYSKYTFEFEDVGLGIYTGTSPAFFVGGGYNYQVGENARFQIIGLYDLLHSATSIYVNPWTIRLGFTVGL